MIDVIGFTDASQFPDDILTEQQRRDPGLTLPDANSIIVAGIYIGGLVMPEWENKWYGRTSRLYLSGFFLDVVTPLKPVAGYLIRKGYQACICDGSAADGSVLPLKLAAVRAGLGWQGKHSLLISKKYGTFLALGGIITDAKLVHNTKKEPDRCRKCTACQTACPMNALDNPYLLKRDKCLSGLLAEEVLPNDAIGAMGNRIGDCEICQTACPWNKKHLEFPLETKMTEQFRRRTSDFQDAFYLSELSKLSEGEYETGLGKLNTQIPYHIFQRNVSIAIKNARRNP